MPPAGSGLGSLLEDAMVLRSAVSLSVAFLGARGVPQKWLRWGFPTRA